jgi:hypothetical protein
MSRLFYIPQAVRIDSTGAPYAGAKANFYLTGTTTRANTYSDNALSTANANPVVADAGGQWAAIYLDPDVTYRCIITDTNDVQLDDVDPIHSPLTASEIAIVDAGSYFAGTELETVLADLGANYAKNSAAETISGARTHSSTINMQDNQIIRPELADYSINNAVVTQSTATPDFDIAGGSANAFTVTLTENATFSLSNPSPTGNLCEIVIKITQGASAYTVAWPASVKWPGGTAPTISVGAGAIDVVTLMTWDAGTTWYGNYSQAYA